MYHPSPKAAQLSAKRYLFSPWFLLLGKVRACEWEFTCPSYAGYCQRNPLPSCLIQNTEVCCVIVWVILGEQQVGLSEGMKRVWILRSACTLDSLGNSPISLWAFLTFDSPPNGPQAPPRLHVPHLHTHNPSWPAPCACSQWQQEWALQRTSECLQKLAALCEIPRNNAKLNVHHCRKKNKREAVNMCPDYAVLREGIKL